MNNDIIAIARIIRDWKDKSPKCVYPVQMMYAECPSKCPFNHPDIGCRYIRTATKIYNDIVNDKCLDPIIYEIYPNNAELSREWAKEIEKQTATEILQGIAHGVSGGQDIMKIVRAYAKEYEVEK